MPFLKKKDKFIFRNNEYTYYKEKIDTIKGFNKLYRINYQEENQGNSYTIIHSLRRRQ